MRIRKGRILRIRPGHLANFSGGAGYMPFIVMLSLPASVWFGIISSVLLDLRGRRLLAPGNGPKTGLHEFIRYCVWHAVACLLIATIAGIALFHQGQRMVYGDPLEYAFVTAVFAAGPLAAWVLSSWLLMVLIAIRGPRGTNLCIAAGVYLFLLAGCIPLVNLVGAVTGARV